VKVGDLIVFKSRPLHPEVCECKGCLGTKGVVLSTDDSHRQTSVTILSSEGSIVKNIWENHIEVVNADR
jgi:hypothetical protein